MRPRSKYEKSVAAANLLLTEEISLNVMKWALTLIKHPAFRTSRRKTTCGDCGHMFLYEGKAKKVKCPKCGKKLTINDTQKRRIDDAIYFGVLDTVEGLQVQRVFRLNVSFCKGKPFTSEVVEICRMWINSKGDVAVTSHARNMMSAYSDSFNLDSDIILRNTNNTHWVISDDYIYPRYKVIPELRLRGLKGKFPNCHPTCLMSNLLKDSRIETLLKAGNIRAVEYFISNPLSLDKCWASHKIAMRNGYDISDYHLWCDTINLLNRLGKDIHNAKYICPADLRAEHDRLVEKDIARVRREAERLKSEEDRKKEEDFYKYKTPYFGISIKDNNFDIFPLISIKDYREEGEAMHHCVFSCGYYGRKDSIVLSARDRMGNRLETVEFSLAEFKVVQSRGVCNSETPYHNQIIKLVNDNAALFAAVKKAI